MEREGGGSEHEGCGLEGILTRANAEDLFNTLLGESQGSGTGCGPGPMGPGQ